MINSRDEKICMYHLLTGYHVVGTTLGAGDKSLCNELRNSFCPYKTCSLAKKIENQIITIELTVLIRGSLWNSRRESMYLSEKKKMNYVLKCKHKNTSSGDLLGSKQGRS